MSEVTTREASHADCTALAELIRELARYEKLEHEVRVDAQTLEQSLFGARSHAYALLAETGGKIAGFCLYFYNFSTFLGRPGVYIEDIFVREAYRGLGIGQLFFARLGEIAKRENCGRIEWSVLDWNTPAHAFYRKLGAQPMDEWTVWRLTEDNFG